MNRCLWDFANSDDKDDFANLKWESPFVRCIDFESCDGEKIYSFKRELSTRRKPKKNKLVFVVDVFTTFEGEEERTWDCEHEHTKEQDARNEFEGEKARMEFFHKRDKEGWIFDGRRYMWEVKDNKLTGKSGWG